MQRGSIRQDFYYRLCSDMIRTPSLREILEDSPGELRNLVLFIAQRVTEPVYNDHTRASEEAEALADEVVGWIGKELGKAYTWPGNFRELEQCVRNILVRREYRPAAVPGGDARQNLADAVSSGALTVDQLLRRYCTLVQAQTMNYEETARRLGIDRRTVKAKVDRALLDELRSN
jgi:DNA-binding NtrC family response regulator